MHWPGTIPEGREITGVTTNMDVLPTLTRLAGAGVPEDRIIDGADLLSLLTGETEESPHEAYYYYKHTHLQAVRSGDWKLVLPRPERPADLGWYGRLQEGIAERQLFDLREDIGERRDVADRHPEVVDELAEMAENAREDLGDRDHPGAGARR